MADTGSELLELAAKAVGFRIKKFTSHASPAAILVGGGVFDPLMHGGTALQMAAKLGISVTPYPIYNNEARHSVIAKQRRSSDTLREANPTEVIELYGDDPDAAWRRAIVRCAAEIGREM